MKVAVDSRTWQDIPIYVREGSVLATQPSDRGNELSSPAPMVLDIFPSPDRVAHFVQYEDDGHTYEYEHGAYFRQEIAEIGRASCRERV